jgi:hypothetical protein
MSWDCHSAQAQKANNFTVLCVLSIIYSTLSLLLKHISLKAPSSAPLAIVAIQKNEDCSIAVSRDKVNQPPATGYTLLLANDLNNTDVSSVFSLLYSWRKLTQHFRSSLPHNHSRSRPLDQRSLVLALRCLRVPVVLEHHQQLLLILVMRPHLPRIVQASSD